MTTAQIVKLLLDMCAEAKHSKQMLDPAEVERLASQVYLHFAKPTAPSEAAS